MTAYESLWKLTLLFVSLVLFARYEVYIVDFIYYLALLFLAMCVEILFFLPLFFFQPKGEKWSEVREKSKIDKEESKFCLPDRRNSHYLVIGGTGSGKTTWARNFMVGKEKNSIVIDPHSSFNEWGCEKVLGQRDWVKINEFFLLLEKELERRYNSKEYQETFIVVDELPLVIKKSKASKEAIMKIAMEGRKVGLFLVLLSQSKMVKQLGFENASDLLDCFELIEL